MSVSKNSDTLKNQSGPSYKAQETPEHLELTGQAKLNGSTIRDLSLSVLGKEKVLPPRTGVVAEPKLQGPAEDTFSWYSFRHTRK